MGEATATDDGRIARIRRLRLLRRLSRVAHWHVRGSTPHSARTATRARTAELALLRFSTSDDSARRRRALVQVPLQAAS